MSLQTVATSSKYGLIKSSANKTASVPLKRPALAAFADDEDEDDEGDREDSSNNKRATINKTNQMLMARQTVLPTAASNMDEIVFDYDGEYDSFKSSSDEFKRKNSSLNQSNAPVAQAQYISSMMATAKMREHEKERIFERKLLREREQEDAQYPDQDKFITSAYKEKLLEKMKWEQEDKRAEELDKKHDVRNQGMAGFYTNLLTKNVAVGGKVETNAMSAYTVGSARQSLVVSSSALSSSTISSASLAPVEPPAVCAEVVTVHADVEPVTTIPLLIESVSDPAIDVVSIKEEKISAARERYMARKKESAAK